MCPGEWQAHWETLGRIMNVIARVFGFFNKTKGNSPASSGLQPAAAAHLQAGRLEEAASLYRQILNQAPQDPHALHMLGVIAHQRGNSTEAADLIRQAIALAPNDPTAYNNLGNILRSQGQLDSATDALGRALEFWPAYPEALNNLGCVLQLQGKQEAARACFTKALEANPTYVEALFNLGNIHKEQGELEKAEECYQTALALRPGLPEAFKALGSLRQRRGLQYEAETYYRGALAARPADGDISNDLGALLASQGRMTEAEACFRQAISTSPDLAEAHNNLGEVLQAQEKLTEAQDSIWTALRIRPSFADALANLAVVYSKMGRKDDAERALMQAITLQPNLAKAHFNLGMLYIGQGKMVEAEVSFRRALSLTPDSAQVKYNLATLALLRGDYDEGLGFYENRFLAFADWRNTSFLPLGLEDRAFWKGEQLSGRHLLVWTEQGLGDSLMVMRYLPFLKAKGAGKVFVYCEPALERLIRQLPGVDEVIPQTDALPFEEFDLHCPAMSLPYLFGTRLDSIPGQIPYLVVPNTLIADWATRLAFIQKIRVGLVWAGSRSLRDDTRRSIPLRHFDPLRRIAGVQMISLQKGTEPQQLLELHWDMLDFMGECHDLMDTAALVLNLDLVISVDTAVAHLAGALGKPIWLLNRFGSEWRWGLLREDSPWYPSMRIFNQDTQGDWTETIRKVATELAHQTALHAKAHT